MPDPALLALADPVTGAELYTCLQVGLTYGPDNLGEDCVFEEYYLYFFGEDVEIISDHPSHGMR